jgi:thymidylate synthase (FAD)
MPEATLFVKLLYYTPEPERACATAARQSHSAVGVKELTQKMSDEQVNAFLKKIIKLNHLSVIEHASFTFGIEGVSRALTHQLVRHRLASYTQQSQRYVKANDFSYVIPPSIKNNPALEKKFVDEMNSVAKIYSEFLEAGVNAEDARFLLPNACETKIVVTMNARELLHFFKERSCVLAQWEIRGLAEEMLRQCREIAPTLFAHAGPSCVVDKVCWQGKRSCGKWKAIEGARWEGE